MKIHIISILIIIQACASITSPTGGPKDEIPPQLVSSTPEDQSLHFKGNTIELEFDEYVILNNPQEQILVTPRLTEKPDVTYRKNLVIFKFNEELLENTTYSVNFRESIQDFNEKNPAEKLTIAFSTGDYIDSAFLEGKVVDHLRQVPLKDVAVGIYKANDTLTIFNSPPDYMTISDEKGNWRINNLSAGKYLIYALIDKNRNSTLDLETERYGFLKDTLHLDSSIVNLQIPVLKNNIDSIKLMSSRTSGKYFLMRYNKSIVDYTINADDSLSAVVEENNILKFYNTISNDSVLANIQVVDSIEMKREDSVYVKFSESPRAKDKYEIKISTAEFTDKDYLLNTELRFNKPSKILSYDSISIFLDSMNIIKPDSSKYTWNKNKTIFSFTTDLKPYIHDSLIFSKTELKILSQSFVSIEADTSQALNTKLKFTTLEKTGTIEIEVSTEESSYIIQLLDRNYKVINQVNNKDRYNFNYLPPTNYIIRVLIDKNQNGKWDPGNIYKRIEPEPVYLFETTEGSREIILRQNFVIGPNVLKF